MRLFTISVLGLALITPVLTEIISLGIGATLIGVASYGFRKFYLKDSVDDTTCWTDCCMELNTYDVIQENLKIGLQKLHGQHVASAVISKAVLKHLNDQNPTKALTLSLHGLTGTGKNYVAVIIADAMYTVRQNLHVHFINCNLDQNEVSAFKSVIRKLIINSSKRCSRSLFVFDEFDKLPAGAIDGISEYFEYNSGPIAKKSIFMFLSNTGGTHIAKAAIAHHDAGKPRENLTYQALSKLVQVAAYNEEGGFKDSKLITKHLVDYFVPFLPLTHEHILQCIKFESDGLKAYLSKDQILEIAESLNYFPDNNPLYSSSGCKSVASQVKLYA